jgi:stage II sporulation protein D
VSVAANVAYVYPDTRSQVYGGIAAETSATNSAAKATAHQVVTYNGRAVRTYFFSTSGGRTAAAEDGPWGGGPIGYLKSVDDPFDFISPYHSWGPIRYTARGLAQAAGGPAGLHDATVAVNPSRRADSVTLVGSSLSRTISGATFQARLALRSTWFRIRVLSLSASARKITYGRSVRLSGFERGLRNLGVQQRPYGGSWEAPAAIAPDSNGEFTVIASPTVTTSYRATSSTGRGAIVQVAVAPRVRVAYSGGAFSGSVAPVGAAAGKSVAIQRKTASGWTTITTARIRADGSFAVRRSVNPGTFRARAALGGGYAVGFARVIVP